MKVAFVVQRCGLEVNGGAELLCRQVAERMAKFWEVEILTTCAIDYMTWRNEYPPGVSLVAGVPVRRFPVDSERDVPAFNRLSDKVLLGGAKSRQEELDWMRAQGPYSTELLRYLTENVDGYDFFFFFTYLYASTFFGLPVVANKAGLVPTAHDEPPIYLDIYRKLFELPRVMVFNTLWEQQFVNRRFGCDNIPQDVVGVGIDVPGDVDPSRFRAAHEGALEGQDFVLCVGRMDKSKGCQTLLSHFMRFREDFSEYPVKLVLVGRAVMEIPEHPDIIPLGFVSEQEKYDAVAAATVVMLPSPYESLSIVALEAWALERPALANGLCETLRTQCVRGNGGLWYENYREFSEALRLLLREGDLRGKLGAAGRGLVEEGYSWGQVEDKYRRLLSLALSPDIDVPGGASPA